MGKGILKKKRAFRQQSMDELQAYAYNLNQHKMHLIYTLGAVIASNGGSVTFLQTEVEKITGHNIQIVPQDNDDGSITLSVMDMTEEEAKTKAMVNENREYDLPENTKEASGTLVPPSGLSYAEISEAVMDDDKWAKLAHTKKMELINQMMAENASVDDIEKATADMVEKLAEWRSSAKARLLEESDSTTEEIPAIESH